jgi:hypothetical protein
VSRKFWVIAIIVLLIIIVGILIFVTSPSQQNGGDENGSDGNTTSWGEAIKILNNGEVEEAYQAHSLDVTLVLKNGTPIYTREPSIDDFFDEVEKCGEPCKDIVVATE